MVGTVKFVPTNAGLFQTEECTLTPVGDGKTSRCSVLFTPTTGALPEVQLTVQYEGDISHVYAEGTGTLKVKKRKASLEIEWEGTSWRSFIPAAVLQDTQTLIAKVYDSTPVGTSTTPEGEISWGVNVFYPGIGLISGQFSANPTLLINGTCTTHLTISFAGMQFPNVPPLIIITATYSGSDIHSQTTVKHIQLGAAEYGPDQSLTI